MLVRFIHHQAVHGSQDDVLEIEFTPETNQDMEDLKTIRDFTKPDADPSHEDNPFRNLAYDNACNYVISAGKIIEFTMFLQRDH